MNWGDGLAADTDIISSKGISDTNPFFRALLQKPYLNQVVAAPHVYPPSISKAYLQITVSSALDFSRPKGPFMPGWFKESVQRVLVTGVTACRLRLRFRAGPRALPAAVSVVWLPQQAGLLHGIQQSGVAFGIMPPLPCPHRRDRHQLRGASAPSVSQPRPSSAAPREPQL